MPVLKILSGCVPSLSLLPSHSDEELLCLLSPIYESNKSVWKLWIFDKNTWLFVLRIATRYYNSSVSIIISNSNLKPYVYELFVFDRNTWNHTTVCKFLVLDRNAWYYMTVSKKLLTNYTKMDINVRWTRFPNSLAWNNPRWSDMPLKSINEKRLINQSTKFTIISVIFFQKIDF